MMTPHPLNALALMLFISIALHACQNEPGTDKNKTNDSYPVVIEEEEMPDNEGYIVEASITTTGPLIDIPTKSLTQYHYNDKRELVLINATLCPQGQKCSRLEQSFDSEGRMILSKMYKEDRLEVYFESKYDNSGDLLSEFRIDHMEEGSDTSRFAYLYSPDRITCYRTNNGDTVSKIIEKEINGKTYRFEEPYPVTDFVSKKEIITTNNADGKPVETRTSLMYSDWSDKTHIDTTVTLFRVAYSDDGLIMKEERYDDDKLEFKAEYTYNDKIIRTKHIESGKREYTLRFTPMRNQR